MLSVVIVNWNTRELLHKCLDSLLKFSTGPMEIIVVDNASTDGSAEMVEANFSEVHLIRPGANTGYAAGNNLGIEAASGDLILTLNPDTEFIDDSLSRCLTNFSNFPTYGVCSIRLVYPTGETQRSIRGFPTLSGIFGDLTGLRRFLPSLDSYRLSRFDYESEQDAPQPMGSFLLFRKVALEAIGSAKKPYDENFPIFFNEVDLLKRLASAGWPCRYFPNEKVIHHGGEGTKQVRKAMIWESHRSLLRYLKKHGPPLDLLLFPLAAVAIYTGAFIRARGYHAGFRP
jgi:GT2 family glycosyltransferase